MGYRRLNIREAGGTHWDNVGGVDLRRARHITLPAERTTEDPGADPSNLSAVQYRAGDMIYYSSAGGPGSSLAIAFGVGDAVYTAGGGGRSIVRRALLSGFRVFHRMVEFLGSDGLRHIYAAGTGTDAQYYRSTDGITWVRAPDIATSGLTEFIDFIVWNSQLIGVTIDNTIVSSADGQNWSTDVGDDPIYRYSGSSGDRKFVGISMAPWGSSAPYFLDDGRLFVLDVLLKRAQIIEDVGDEHALWHGVSWNGALWLTDGLNIWQYTPGGGGSGTVRLMGPFNQEGVPPSWSDRGLFASFPTQDESFRIVQFVPGAGTLLAICRRFSELQGVGPGNDMRILMFNGAGWSWWGPNVASAIPQAALINKEPLQNFGGFIHIIASAEQFDDTLTMHNWRTSIISGTPQIAWKEAFEDGPLDFETGWVDGGFRELEGSLYRLHFDGYNMTDTETVRIEYRLNNEEGAAYRDLGTFKKNQGVLWFDNEHLGVAFTTVQFRITLDRGSDKPLSPEMRSLVLLYDKRPQLRTAWTIRLDLNRMVERGMTIDGEAASIESAWQKLRELWNTPTLLKLVVPSLEGLGINVKMVDLPGTFDEIRKSQGGKGFVDIQLLEPVV